MTVETPVKGIVWIDHHWSFIGSKQTSGVVVEEVVVDDRPVVVKLGSGQMMMKKNKRSKKKRIQSTTIWFKTVIFHLVHCYVYSIMCTLLL